MRDDSTTRNPAIGRIAERVRQARASGASTQARATIAGARSTPPAPSPAGPGALTFQPGDRVVDMTTGEEVEILAGDKTDLIVPSAKG